MNAFKGYCYSTIIEAANAEIAEPAFSSNLGVVVPISFSSTSATAGNLTYQYKPLSNTPAATYVLPRVYPACSEVGYLTNYSGLSLTDAVTVSWLVVLAWSLAYAVKVLRRAL